MSLWFIVTRGGPALGAFLTGALAEQTDLVTAFLVGCALCLAAVASVWRRRTALAGAVERPYRSED
jgi:hypothetical protein